MVNVKILRLACCLFWCAPMGCMLDDGQGFTIAKLSGEVQWDSNNRIGDEGRFRTSKSYEIDFERFDLSVRAVALTTAPQLSNDVFDPANPPAGYSLCHNGHCHADSGELVDYDKIILSLGGSSSGKEVGQIIKAPVTLDLTQATERRRLMLGACTDIRAVCEVGPDSVNAATMHMTEVSVKLRAFKAGVLPDEGTEFDLVVPLPVPIQKPLSIALDTEGPNDITLSFTLFINASVWDHIEFSDLVDESAEGQADAFSMAMTHGLYIDVN